MEQISNLIRDRRKAELLRSFLKTLDYIESISTTVIPATHESSKINEAEFFSLAGIWADRAITQESLRRLAY